MSQNPYLYEVQSIEEGLKKLSEPRTIFHVVGGMLKGYYKENHKTFPELTIFGATKMKFTNLIFTKNSPLKPIFQKALAKTFERGQHERLVLEWEGRNVPSRQGSETMILSAGQVFLIFGILSLAMLASLICLVLELLHHRLSKRGLFANKV